jgi:predicted methyltransferase
VAKPLHSCQNSLYRDSLESLQMKPVHSLFVVVPLCLGLLPAQLAVADHHGEAPASLEQIMVGDHRSDANIVRNQSRHPVETLEFFGLRPDMTLIEIGPSGGWYAEILAPYMRDQGRYFGAHFSPNSPTAFHRRSLENFEEKIRVRPDIYGKATIRHLLPPDEVVIGPAEGADMALTFRNVHNWIMAGLEHEYFEAFYGALKPGGILGVVEHRAKPDAGMEVMRTTGYVTEDYVKEIAAAAGFEFVASAEINANPMDTKEYPEGVWTLPPEFRMGDVDREKYAAIGESDRMTLKFRKPQ